jgi:LacI family transcriptional regulator
MKQATINDVARAAGVSSMTVSRALNRSGYISEDTRLKVEAAAAALDYRPNALAQGMRSNATGTVGFILPDITNSTNAVVAQTAERELARAGYRLLLGSTGFDPDLEANFLQSFQRRTVDGVIAVLADDTSASTHALLKTSRVPVVIIDRDLPFPVDTVFSEHEKSMHQVVSYLVGLGHRRIGLIMSPITMRPGRLRVAAFMQAMLDAGVTPDPALVRWERQLVQEGYRAALDLLQIPDRPSALIVGANQQTFGALKAVRKLGLRVPEELSLVGADEHFTTSLVEPPLSVIWRDMELVGSYAAQLLLERLRKPARTEVRTITVPSEVIIRRSCAVPR